MGAGYGQGRSGFAVYLEERRADFHPSNGHPLGTHPGNKTESWCVCPGSVDRSETHAQCRRAVRLFPGAHRRDPSPRRPMGSCARFPGGRGCAELERHQPSAGGGLRPLRHRQHGAQGIPEPVCERRGYRDGLSQSPAHEVGSSGHAELDRWQRRFHSGL